MATEQKGRAPAPPGVGANGDGPRPILRQTVAGATVQAIRHGILTGAYPEGTALRQDALAKELSVSRIPVREALRQLESEGLVTLHAHQGATVSSLSLAEIRELFELRALIEARLLERAIPALEEEQLERAGEILREYEAALEGGEVGAWPELNWRFHSALFMAARRPVATAILKNLHDQSERYLRMQLTLTHGGNQATEEHRAMLQSAADRDVVRARELVSSHILGAGERLLAYLEEERSRADQED